jgi:hypothetical protein
VSRLTYLTSVVFRGPERPRPRKPKWASLPFWFMVLCYLPTNTASADAMGCASSHPGEAPVLVAAPAAAPASAVPLKRRSQHGSGAVQVVMAPHMSSSSTPASPRQAFSPRCETKKAAGLTHDDMTAGDEIGEVKIDEENLVSLPPRSPPARPSFVPPLQPTPPKHGEHLGQRARYVCKSSDGGSDRIVYPRIIFVASRQVVLARHDRFLRFCVVDCKDAIEMVELLPEREQRGAFIPVSNKGRAGRGARVRIRMTHMLEQLGLRLPHSLPFNALAGRWVDVRERY